MSDNPSYLTSSCVEWQGARHKQGYGNTRYNGKGMGAHRRAWIEAHGPIADGMHVLHRCDNPACVRPDHLFLGTQRDNIADMDAKGRRRFGPTLRGDAAPWSKLTEVDIPVIRQLAADGMTPREIGRRYGVHYATIYLILRGKNWRHV